MEQLLIQQYNKDFLEHRNDVKEEMSQEDKLFMQSVERTAKFTNGHYCVGFPLRDKGVKMANTVI